MWRPFRTAHGKVDDFRKGRTRQVDDAFVADCGLADGPEAAGIAIGVRRAIADVGLIDPLFILASDRIERCARVAD